MKFPYREAVGGAYVDDNDGTARHCVRGTRCGQIQETLDWRITKRKPKIISIGNIVCRRNTKKNGFSRIVKLKDVLCASCMKGRTSTRLFCAILLYIESMVCRVECIRSDTELPCER